MTEDKEKIEGAQADQATKPKAKKPAKPKATKPKVAKPKAEKSKVAKPKAKKPAKPKATKPKVAKPKAEKPKVAKPKAEKVEKAPKAEEKATPEAKETAKPASGAATTEVKATPVAAKPAVAKKAPPPKKEEPPPLGLVVSSSPHLLTGESVPKIMHNVVMALVPAMIAALYIFGYRAAVLIVTCVVTSIITEAIFQKARKKPVTVYDGSAIITGILLALTLPPSFPILGAMLGSIFAIAIGKQIFGGLGYNIFNPALLGRAFLQAAFPVLITTWSEPFVGAVEAVSAATPLALMKFESVFASSGSLFMGGVPGAMGETSALAILIGGLYLRYKGYINWRMPLGYLGSIAFFGALFWIANPAKYPNPLFHIFAGGAMLGAWFMVTDMVTSPITARGQWIFVIAAGFLVVIIRLFGGLPEGVMYSILLMNSIVPLLNRWTRPKIFGQMPEEKAPQ